MKKTLKLRATFGALALAALLHVGTEGRSKAFTHRGGPDDSKTYCVERAPNGISRARAETLLDRAVGNGTGWEAPGETHGTRAISLSRSGSCGAGKLEVTTCKSGCKNSTVAYIGRNTFGVPTHIFFNDEDHSFWDGIGTRASHEFSYEGVLKHEMGHAHSINHAGNVLWTYDSSNSNDHPTMAGGGSQSSTVHSTSLQQDDWGSASWVGSSPRYWNANPGFEHGTSFWGTSGLITHSSNYRFEGSKGIRSGAYNDYVFVTQVYDPYAGNNCGKVTNHMTTTPGIKQRTKYKNLSTSAGKGAAHYYKYRYLRYNSCDHKYYASSAYTSWSAKLYAGTCSRNTSWATCTRRKNYTLSVVNDAVAHRAYVHNNSGASGGNSSAVYFDSAGVLAAE